MIPIVFRGRSGKLFTKLSGRKGRMTNFRFQQVAGLLLPLPGYPEEGRFLCEIFPFVSKQRTVKTVSPILSDPRDVI